MQHTKDKKSISEITKYCGDSKKLTGTFEGLLKNFNLTYINTLFSKTKTKGIDSKKIFQILFTLRFLDLTHFTTTNSIHGAFEEFFLKFHCYILHCCHNLFGFSF